MKYLRVVLEERIPVNGAREGFFRTAYQLRRTGGMSKDQFERLDVCLNYLDEHIDVPYKFSKSRTKCARHRNTKGLSWFKSEATAVVDRALELTRLLEELGIPTKTLRTDRVGFIVFEDDVQIVAEPFSDKPV